MGNDSQGLTWSGLLSLGVVSACTVMIGFGIGWWADGILNTSPILVVAGIAVGIAAAISFTFVRLRSYLRE
ncbi:MAG: AtpZ/AtpI family protein [Jatrophihabitantaceae bacterium]